MIKKTSPALQAALDAIDEAIPESADESQQLIRSKCRALVVGYDARWRDAGYVTLSVEETIQSDLFNPDTNRSSRSFRIAGKRDAKAMHGSRSVLFDHKTCSQDITDPNAPYWRQLVIEGQASHYMLIDWLNGQKVDDAVWDVVRKPGIAPKNIAKKDRQAALVSKEYCGAKLSQATLEWLQVQERESFEMYEARLVHDCTQDRPGWYFQRRSVPRMDREILDYARELWSHSQDILYTRNKTTDDSLPPRNSGACMLYGSPCKFLGICSGHDSVDSDHWQFKPRMHRELPELDGDGRDVLTNSRIRCFQTCRRKHYYEFELGIERQDEEERESLFFGTVWHSALESWFRCFLPREKSDVNCAEFVPASAVGTTSHSQATVAG